MVSNAASPLSRARSSGDRPGVAPGTIPGPAATTASTRGRSESWTAMPLCPGKALVQVADQPVDSHPVLSHRVAVAHRDGPVLERVEIHGDAVGRADLVLSAVAAADRAGVVVVDHPALA